MQIKRIGEGLAVVLPPELVETLGLKEGDEVEVRPVAKPAASEIGHIRHTAPDLPADELFARMLKHRGSLPADYKFDREELYERGRDEE